MGASCCWLLVVQSRPADLTNLSQERGGLKNSSKNLVDGDKTKKWFPLSCGGD
jgi:hypothetical protein